MFGLYGFWNDYEFLSESQSHGYSTGNSPGNRDKQANETIRTNCNSIPAHEDAYPDYCATCTYNHKHSHTNQYTVYA
jgi:hypothetical protein